MKVCRSISDRPKPVVAFTFQDKDKFVSAIVLAFTAMLSVIFYLVIERFRMAFNGYIDNINKMDGDMGITLKGFKAPSTMRLIQIALAISGGLSVLSFIYVVWYR